MVSNPAVRSRPVAPSSAAHDGLITIGGGYRAAQISCKAGRVADRANHKGMRVGSVLGKRPIDSGWSSLLEPVVQHVADDAHHRDGRAVSVEREATAKASSLGQ